MFHIGHLNLLCNAKNECEYLIVGVLTDELAIHFKRKSPYIIQEERAEIIRQIKYVDQVVMVDKSNIDKMKAWEKYKFDCLFSGDDWGNEPSWIKDKEKLQGVGSDIIFFPYTQSTSSSKIKATLGLERANENIFIFGAGSYGRAALQDYGRKNVNAFVDNDANKWGTQIDGIAVRSIDEVLEELKAGEVIVAMKQFDETVKQLKDLGVNNIELFG